MVRQTESTLGWLTSILLIIVTLYAFFRLQNYGPDSTIRKFHQAAAENNRSDALGLVEPSFDSQPTQELWNYVLQLMASGQTKYAITYTKRGSGHSLIVVKYQFSDGFERSLVWDLKRDDGIWKIDTWETALAIRYLSSPRARREPVIR